MTEDEVFAVGTHHRTLFLYLSSSLSLWTFVVSFSDKPTPDFEEFQNFLGQKIKLQGWDKYKGGLDTKSIWPLALSSEHKNTTQSPSLTLSLTKLSIFSCRW
jgi:hypothetical protein